jgi:hypothetical protein
MFSLVFSVLLIVIIPMYMYVCVCVFVWPDQPLFLFVWLAGMTMCLNVLLFMFRCAGNTGGGAYYFECDIVDIKNCAYQRNVAGGKYIHTCTCIVHTCTALIRWCMLHVYYNVYDVYINNREQAFRQSLFESSKQLAAPCS